MPKRKHLLDEALLRSVSKTLLKYDIDTDDAATMIEVLRGIPIREQTASSLLEEVSEADAVLAAVTFKYAARLDDAEEDYRAATARYATDYAEELRAIGKTPAGHLVDSHVEAQPEVRKARKKRSDLQTLVAFLDNVRWALVRKAEASREIYRKEG